MLEVADLVSKGGGEVTFSSSDEVARLIESRGYTCNDVPIADVRYSDYGKFSLRETMIASPITLARTYQQTRMEVANIGRFRPQVVLSDSALSTVLAARLLRLPVITVLNQLNLTDPSRRGVPVRLLSAGVSTGMGKLWELSDEVLLPDLPPPYTISERNLWGSRVRNTRYIGFLHTSSAGASDGLGEKLASDPRKKIFWQVSGPPKTRGPFLAKVLEIAGQLSDRFVSVVSAGDPAGRTVAEGIPGGWCYGWCRAPEPYFALCDLVVSRAGHGTIGQAIASSRPSLLVPIPGQAEQEGNAAKAVRLGVSACVGQDELTADRALEEIGALLDGRAEEKTRALHDYASKFDAVGEVVRTLSSAAT
jgi:UDP:flavonoid glycosyltransferase YjiC (YdhE family)